MIHGLFIGGPLDGQWKVTGGEQTILADVDRPGPLLVEDRPPRTAPGAASCAYHRTPFAFGGVAVLHVYVAGELQPGNPPAERGITERVLQLILTPQARAALVPL